MKSTSNNRNPGFLRRSFRSLLSITVLSALVLSISYFIKYVSTLDTETALNYTAPLLGRLGIDKESVGEVAGKVSVRVSQDIEELNGAAPFVEANTDPVVVKQDSLLKIAVLADSHDDSVNLASALDLASKNNANLIFHLGDITNLGLIEDLEKAKELLEASTAPYFALPGDRDLWQSVGTQNFLEVFESDFHTVTFNGINLVLLNNSATYTPISQETLDAFASALLNADFVFLSQPLYHPLNSKSMGYDAEGEIVQELYDQAQSILTLVRASNVKAVISAEHHISSNYSDPVKPELRHITVGAVTSTVNNRPQRLLQSPRFSILNVFEDRSFKMEEIILP